MKTAVKFILVCLFIQASAILSNNSHVSAQELYTNPDTIQQYLKDRIKDVKEQLKATKSKLKEEERTLRILNRDLTKSRTQAQRDKKKLKEAKRNGKFYQANSYITQEPQDDVVANV